MPIKWYGTSDKSDPTYKHFSRIVNLTLHAMSFGAINSGMWFFQQVKHPWEHLNWFTDAWLVVLLVHLGFVISKRPGAVENQSSS